MKNTILILFVAAMCAAGCQKEIIVKTTPEKQLKSAAADAPMKGTWQLLGVRTPNSPSYIPPGGYFALTFTDHEVIGWGFYVYTETTITVVMDGGFIKVMQYKIFGNSMTLTMSNGEKWKMGKTS